MYADDRVAALTRPLLTRDSNQGKKKNVLKLLEYFEKLPFVMLDELVESMDENRNTLFNLLLHSA
jgi:hypothetical protein